ncbi:GNAT family N-acetyltransferase [Saccharothrix sp. NRRL B-16314]|uniref:GNAT family N-acetyltransferase n=1 Tax=Saccharothrix sp. NRRL B-16314 TaxID=1463825 RepID=UPI0009E06365|nr:GNAT family N-acetyltransferase [Saccharothrix sp. NRRL B-16314]
MTDVSVSHNPDRSRYEVRVDGEPGGFAEYTLADGVVTFTHTVVGMEGKGLGGKLVRHALEDVRAKGLTVVAECSFVRGYVEKHPELIEATDK